MLYGEPVRLSFQITSYLKHVRKNMHLLNTAYVCRVHDDDDDDYDNDNSNDEDDHNMCSFGLYQIMVNPVSFMCITMII